MNLQYSYVPCEKSNIVSLISSSIKSIVVSPARSKFLVKLICCITFRYASITCYLLKSVAINL